MLCDAWLHIGTNPISDAEQKGGHFWRWIYLYFHEHRKFKLDNFESDQNEVSFEAVELHSIRVQSFLWRTREHDEPQAKWPRCQRVGKMFSPSVLILLCYIGILCLALILGATSIELLQ
jgi:hypothetical protein